MKSSPLVSIWMITYNHENYIREAIDSILMQEVDFDYEIVIGEDCSTDGTREILLEYAEQYPEKFKLLLHDKNLGLIENMLTTFRACSGTYIATLEGDDFWTDPLKLQKQVDFLEEHEEYSMCYHAIDNVTSDGTYINTFTEPYDCTAVELMTGQFIMQTSSNMHRNIDLIYPDAFREENLFDPFLIHLYGFYGKAKYLSEIGPSKWRRHEKGLWSGQDDIAQTMLIIRCKRLMRRNLEKEEHIKTLNKVLKDRYLELLYVYLRDKSLKDYFALCRIFSKDEEISLLTLYPQHLLDTSRRIINKLIKGRSV